MPSKRLDGDSGTRSGNSRKDKEPHWVSARLLVYVHRELMEEHGGAVGAVDVALLDSACARPHNLWAYTNPRPGLAALAATLGYGLARNHCFIDGNKRIALAAIDVFLRMNGFYLNVSETEAVVIFREIAAGAMDEAATNQWIRDHMAKADKPVLSK